MARTVKKKQEVVDVQKFGGTEELGQINFNGYEHSAATSEAQSETKLEHDCGDGGAVVIRRFSYGANPASFKEAPPTKQELFNAHVKEIEIRLWQDGLKIFEEVEPRISLGSLKYEIYVAARPMKGHSLGVRPQTLSEIARGESFGTE